MPPVAATVVLVTRVLAALLALDLLSGALALGGARLRGYRRRGLVGRPRLLDRRDGGLGFVREPALAVGDVLELVGVLFDALAPAALVDQALRLLSQLLQIHLFLSSATGADCTRDARALALGTAAAAG